MVKKIKNGILKLINVHLFIYIVETFPGGNKSSVI